jgi:hypothetical protein
LDVDRPLPRIEKGRLVDIGLNLTWAALAVGLTLGVLVGWLVWGL